MGALVFIKNKPKKTFDSFRDINSLIPAPL